jgi:hypothetical protein
MTQVFIQKLLFKIMMVMEMVSEIRQEGKVMIIQIEDMLQLAKVLL